MLAMRQIAQIPKLIQLSSSIFLADAAMQPHEAIDCFSRPSTVLLGRDVEKVTKLAECLKLFLSHRADAFVQKRLHSPILEVFMSDGTPLTTTTRVEGMVEGEKIVRSGKHARSF